MHNLKRLLVPAFVCVLGLFLVYFFLPGSFRFEKASPVLREGWSQFDMKGYDFTFSYPSRYKVEIGNDFSPTLPPNTISLSPEEGTFSVGISTFPKKGNLNQVLRNYIEDNFGSYKIDYISCVVSGSECLQAHFIQDAMNTSIEFSVTALSFGKNVTFFRTQYFDVKDPTFAEYTELLKSFSKK